MVIFVPGTAPGDLVEVQITEQKPRFAQAKLIKILEPSSSRRTPPCPVAGRCGGCPWQHVTYATQVAQKEKILRDSLRKLEKLRAFEWRPFIPAENEFNYRNRIQLHIRDGRAGFFAQGTRELVAIEKCWIAEDALNQRFAELTPEERKATRVEIALRPDGEVAVMLEKRDAEEALFSQVNTAQNERLIGAMLELVDGKPDWIFDLYAGAGNLTAPLARRFPDARIEAVELSRASVERAPRISNAVFHTGDVAKILATLEAKKNRGLIVIDPPRAGADVAVIEQVRRHSPHQVIYISCNPSTFARDAERLCGGFHLRSVQGLDMFPQTEHVELIASLCAAT